MNNTCLTLTFSSFLNKITADAKIKPKKNENVTAS